MVVEGEIKSALEQIAEAEVFKQEGNERVKAGEYKKALSSYHKVFLYLNGLSMPGEQSEAAAYSKMIGGSNPAQQVPDDRVEDVKALRATTWMNMGLCYIKTGAYPKCIDVCTKALEVSKQSKAYFRRGQAHLELRHLDEAKADLEMAKDLEPSSTAIQAELKRLKLAFAQHEAKEKKKYSKLFAKMAGDPQERKDEAPQDEAAQKASTPE
eukprot:TRINITY_DN103787_c0_g1_i1.p1 TRINITY_DN103787_c0_g1~~TRINITY_DN103787_c0_g1_i1.p1  ORF type:complete len:211 (+),score=70.65 TRINITY_DN103787_c0_g1_i1:90-722(+)